jgi:ABC-type enterochelin transport system permease subunit
MELVDSVLRLGVFLVPIVAIIVGGVIAIVAMMHAHEERLAKIQRGIDPDLKR